MFITSLYKVGRSVELLEIWFCEEIPYVGRNYTGLISYVDHINTCIPKHEWLHVFIYTLNTIPRNWFISLEL